MGGSVGGKVKGKQGIRWSACGQTSKNRNRIAQLIAAEALLDAVTALMFLLSARSMLQDAFHWRNFSVGLCAWIVLMAICVSAVMGLSEQWSEGRRRMARGLVLLGGLLGFLLYYFGKTAHEVFVSTGLREIVRQFVDSWNAYYNTDFLAVGGIARNITAALDFYLLLIGFVLLWVAKLCNKKLIVGILPALVFGAELLVGYAPKTNGLLLFAFGIVSVNLLHFKRPEFNPFQRKKYTAGRNGGFSWLPVLLAVVLLSNVLVYIAKPCADMVIANSGSIRKTIQNWIDEHDGQEPTEPKNPEEDNNGGLGMQLSNKMPVFKRIPVMSFWMKGPAQGNIYLKESSAGKYVDGLWESDVDSFENYFREKGLDPVLVSKELLQREVKALAKSYDAETLARTIFGKSMFIEFLESFTGKLAVPYFSELSNDDRIQTIGDGYYTRVKDVALIALEVWVYETDYMSSLTHFENPDSPLVAWGYDDYVRSHYLAVPEEMDTVRSLAASLYSDEKKPDLDSENALRLYKADLVADWLVKNTEYSVYLPRLPQGEDGVEYFLGQSKKGYCMHYASASVMLLRQLGVPARLATGYMVPKNNVVGTATNYFAQVEDDKAHAWVEVYLDGMGWFPVEVTKGYRVVNSDTPPDDGPTEETGVTEPTEDEELTEPTEETQEESSESTETPEASGGSTGDPGTENPQKRTRWVLITICASLLAMSGAVVVIKWKHAYRDKLWGLIRRQKTSLAIWLMNRRVYRKLRLTGKITSANIWDDSYEKLLKKNYPDIPAEAWERYMELVKAASFSERKFSKEEVKFCYEMYKKVKPHS